MPKKIAPRIHSAGILQWQSYRILEEHLDRSLEIHKISAPEWKTLGIVFDAGKDGIRSLQIAKKLGVKPPLVTRVLESLERKKLINIRHLKEDARVRLVLLTSRGEKVFLDASMAVGMAMYRLLDGVAAKDRKAYKRVLIQILENGRELQ